jgi:acyl-coenzyme A thioesterase PaaI-like protein
VVKPPAGQILSIRSAVHAGFIRIVLDSAAALQADRAAQRNPRVAGVELAAGWQPARQGRLLGKSLSYRVETTGGRTRLLFESAEAIRIKAVSALPPDQPGGRHRLILDVATGG